MVMKKSPNWRWPVATLIAVTLSVVTLNAQRGGRGTGGRDANKPAPSSPATGNAASGKQLYYSYGCYACHGYNGETGARPFVGRWGHLANEQEFVTFLRGRVNVAPVAPSTAMPNFSAETLPDQKAKDIYAYIRTFTSSAPELKDIPTLSGIVEAARQEKK
jgi:mono/diheme cytochrome c family protein